MDELRLIDSDILTYAMNDKHVAHSHCWPIVERAVLGKIQAALSIVSFLEAYNSLVRDYEVDPAEASSKLDGLSRSRKVAALHLDVDIVRRALEIARNHRARSFDAAIVASAENNKISIIVSNDAHIRRLCEERGLVIENPVPKELRRKMEE